MTTAYLIQTLKSRSILTWPSWLRVLIVAPAILLLWLAVFWASAEVGL
ncbi:MAG: hypothetical protein ABL923_00900 [Burkholderiaceae bacterium]